MENKIEIDRDVTKLFLEVIESAAQKMGQKLAYSSKGRSKKTDEELLLEISELREIKLVILSLKAQFGFMTEDEIREIAVKDRRIRDKVEQIRACRGDYRKLNKQLKEKRLAWWQENKDKLNLTGSLVRQAFTMGLFEYMAIDPKDIQIIYEDERKITWRSYNFCPILEACKIMGLDTRVVCMKADEESIQDFVACLSPKLRFSRSYVAIRPYADYCEETLELVD